MYVCLCHAIKETDIKAAVERGCDDLEALGKCLGVGTRCGICRCEAQAIIDAAHQHSFESLHALECGNKGHSGSHDRVIVWPVYSSLHS